MPDGKTHRKIYKKYSPLISVPISALLIYGYWYLAIWVAIGYIIHGLGITPDLDLEGINDDEGRWIDSFFLIPMVAWSTMYARIIRKFGSHRGILSHGFFISSLIRLLWFGFPFVMLFRYFFIDPLYIEFFGMFIGLSIADALHILADIFIKKDDV